MIPIESREGALGVLETASVARGVVALDAMIKRVEIDILVAQTISPGRYLILIAGPEANVEEALAAAQEAAQDDCVDSLLLWDPSPHLREALAVRGRGLRGESLAVVETSTVSAGLRAADRCLKALESTLLELRLGAGLDGKTIFTLTGPLHMLSGAMDEVAACVGERLVRFELIAQPHPELPQKLLGAETPEPRGTR